MKISAFDSMRAQDMPDSDGWQTLEGDKRQHDYVLSVFPHLAQYTIEGEETFSLSPKQWAMMKMSIASAKHLTYHLNKIIEENGFTELRVVNG